MFSCAWAAGISNCMRIAPKGMQATVQAIYQVRRHPQPLVYRSTWLFK